MNSTHVNVIVQLGGETRLCAALHCSVFISNLISFHVPVVEKASTKHDAATTLLRSRHGIHSYVMDAMHEAL